MCKRVLNRETADTGEIPFFKIGTFGKKANAFITRDRFEYYRTHYAYPKKGNVLISAAGTIGRLVVFDGAPAYFQDSNIVWLEHDGQRLCDKYLYYSLLGHEWQFTQGATIQRLYNDDVRNTEIPLPPLPVQRRIADILSAYDDLIENNRRRIAILEETARLAYRKCFCGSEQCRTATLGEIADVVMGQSPESKTYNDNGEGLPFHQGVTGFGFRYPRNEMWCTAGTRFAEEGDILFSVRAPVGRINVAGERIVIGRGLSAMRAKNGFQSWLLYALKHHFSKEDMIGVGCIFASTTKKELLSVALPFPPDEEIASFEQIAGPIDAQIKAQSKQNAVLATARDMLLPRLMKRDLMCLDMSDTDTIRRESRLQIPPFPNRGYVSDFGGAL
jgi:type I restriction enzyme S subunit